MLNRKTHAALLAAIAGWALPGHAYANFWKNIYSNGIWSNGSSWSAVSPNGTDNAGVPTYNTGASITHSSGSHIVTLNQDASVYSLYIGAGGGGTNTLMHTSGFALSGNYQTIGETGRGVLTQTGGSNTLANSLTIGRFFSSHTIAHGTYNLSGGGTLSMGRIDDFYMDGMYLGYNATAVFNQSGASTVTIGTPAVPAHLRIGYDDASDGTYTLANTASLTVTGDETLGRRGPGTFTQTGGTHVVNGSFTAGSTNRLGQYNMSGGTAIIAGNATLGENLFSTSGGKLKITGGTMSIAGLLRVNNSGPVATGNRVDVEGNGILTVGGIQSPGNRIAVGSWQNQGGRLNLAGPYSSSIDSLELDAQGTLAQSGGTFSTALRLRQATYLLSGGTLVVTGWNEIYTHRAAFTHTGGTHTTTAPLLIGINNASIPASYTLSGTGILTVNNDEQHGVNSGKSTFAHTGGTHTVGSSFDQRNFYLGHSASSVSTYTQSGGTITVNGTAYVGFGGSGTFTQTGGAHNATTALRVAESAGASGSYTISAGTLNTPLVNINSGGTFNYDGGTVSTIGLTLGGSGTMKIASGAGKTLRTSSLSVDTAGGAKLDLTSNGLIVNSGSIGTWNGSNYTGVTGLIRSGRNGGAWNGGGIVTSMSNASGAAAIATIGVATAGAIATTTFGGISVSPTDVLAMYTYAGDANLDGVINGDDFHRIDTGYATPGGIVGFSSGDFNFSGNIDADDYWLIDRNYARNLPPLLGAPAPVAAVPEPMGVAVASTAALLLARQRRRPRHIVCRANI